MQLHVRVLLGYLLLVLITTMDVTPVYAASAIEEIIVTARKREEEESKRMREVLSHADGVAGMGELAATLAHDFICLKAWQKQQRKD